MAGALRSGRLPSRRVFINILFLRVVQAHQGLDRLDHPLRIPHDIAVSIGRGQIFGKAADEACEV